jgi:hypothetical protein
MSLSIRSQFGPVRTLDFSSIGGTYTMVGSEMDIPARQVFIQNYTDQPLMFSFNGVDDSFPLLPSGLFIKDTTSNKTQNTGFFIPKGKALYVKTDARLSAVAPTSGSVWFSVIYGFEN